MSTRTVKPGKKAVAVPIRAVIYLRLSDLRTTDRDTFKAREAKIRELADRLGWPVVEVVRENDYSKSKNGKVRIASAFKRKRVQLPDGEFTYRVIRPGFQRIMGKFRSGEWNAILAEDLDRVVRDPFDGEELLTLSSHKGINARSVSGSLTLTNGGTSDEQFMFRTMVNAAYKSSSDYARRVREARERNMCRAMGTGGNRPFGWQADYKTADPTERAIIDGAMRRVLHGISLMAIATELRDGEVPTVTGAKWSAKILRDIILKPRNAGLVVYQGEIQDGLTGEWDRLVPVELWRAVHDKLTDSARTIVRPDGMPYGISAPKWQGTGVYLCGICDDGTSVQVTIGTEVIKRANDEVERKRRQPRYKCKEHNHLARNAGHVDTMVSDWIIDRLSRDDAISMFVPSTPEVDVAALQAERDSLQADLTVVSDDYYVHKVSKRTQFLSATQKINVRVAEIDRILTDVFTGGSLISELVTSRDVRATWESYPLATKQAVIRGLCTVKINRSTAMGNRFDRSSVVIAPTQWQADQIAA